MEDNKLLIEIIAEIKKKRELSGLANSLVGEVLISYLSNRKINISQISVLSARDRKFLVKEIHAKLRLFHGRFQASTKNRKKMLQQDNFSTLLGTHASTKERLIIYPKIKLMISNLNVRSILDLGCGLNPIALASPGIEYHASDINESELEIVNAFFKKKNIPGNAFFYDLTKFKKGELPKADIALFFKIFDILKKKSYRLIEEILTGLESKYVLVSFSTKKLSGKAMNSPKRMWFESTLSKLNLKYEIFHEENESFYLIRK